ncbi:YcxB-like protein [Propionicimonas paludicola]|uniref:YcxB-like protein n=1 Tax=Propionicimonas paludicola TaxID=185243 RepID=A0A2A9CPV9_9ACTN|nr:YcxB-like protein [Propionicimonas paludicola]
MLEFELTTEDFVAFSIYGALSAPAVQKRSARLRIGASAAMFVGLGLAAGLQDGWLYGLVAGLIAAAVFWLIWPPLWAWSTKRNVMRLAESGGLGKPGPCRIWIDQYGVHDATPDGTSTVSWRGIDRVEETPSHAFIFVGPIQAYVIPKRIGGSAVADFLAAVRAGLATA